MKHVIATARNIRHVVTDDGIEQQIEAVITTAERRAEFTGAGISSLEHLETHRLVFTPESAKALAASLCEWANEAESEGESLTLETED